MQIRLKCHFMSECESETVLSGRRVVELGLLSKELVDGCKYCKVLYSCQTVGRKLCLDLAASSILPAEKIIVVKLMCVTPAKFTE